MNIKKALDTLEEMPGCLSACLLTAKGEVVIGGRSPMRADSVHAMLLHVLQINTIFRERDEKHALHGITIMDDQKKIITRFTGKSSDRVLLAVEIAKDANEQKIKLKIYSLFEME